ncbi:MULTISPECIES: L,D-transpeptidase family protein [unclassified Photobacterium]|uniref:L,D-transpeptidase family protein n=1 Tax=unclassified Photobacterium TaxID=2628852 RepID=UPI001EE01F47|nr:L,D-transpeptidase family protein [Photobacterium sp. Ph6]MCG3875051.1 L,D-transpeptidase family protein [Photobacterium sp. Ph5]
MFKKALLPLLVMFTVVTDAQAAYSYSTYPPAGTRTVDDVMKRYSPFVEPRIKRYFEQAGLSYPPKNIALFAMKEEMSVELWAEEKGKWSYVKRYNIEKISGKKGPKLREGDKQVPEGIYRVSLLNPNSRFHLSMKLDYPNAFDRKYARLEGRTSPGSNIFIHGKQASTGCLAMGDYSIEELFLLAQRTGLENIEVVISPHDPKKGKLLTSINQPFWTQILYRNIEQEARKFGR